VFHKLGGCGLGGERPKALPSRLCARVRRRKPRGCEMGGNQANPRDPRAYTSTKRTSLTQSAKMGAGFAIRSRRHRSGLKHIGISGPASIANVEGCYLSLVAATRALRRGIRIASEFLTADLCTSVGCTSVLCTSVALTSADSCVKIRARGHFFGLAANAAGANLRFQWLFLNRYKMDRFQYHGKLAGLSLACRLALRPI
jgi:hypothetical protein